MIAAAGSGDRLGAGGPKALVEVAGRPLVAWSLDAFAAADSIAAAVVAVPAGREAEFAVLAPEARIVAGGETRSASVGAGLAQVETELVAVHDAARPLVTARLVDALIARLAANPDVAGVIAAARVTDTVKLATDTVHGPPAVARTEDRDRLWAAQTPQVFRTDALRAAHAADAERTASASDDAILVEAAGGTVLIEETPGANIKVTAPADLLAAAALLAGRS